jgi:hypothetical protein
MAATTATPAAKAAPSSSPVVGSDLASAEEAAERQPQLEEQSEEDTYVRDTDLGPHDVLLGRGAPFLNYTGNRRFRAYVQTLRGIYGAARRNRIKNEIARRVVDEIVGRRGGRFLVCVADAAATAASSPSSRRKLSSLGVPPGTRRLWKLAEEGVMLEKCKQTLRDKDPEEDSSSSSRKKNSTQKQEQPGVRAVAAAEAADELSSAISSKKRKSPSSFSSHHHDHGTEAKRHHQQYHYPDEETNSMRYRATTPIRTSSHRSHHHQDTTTVFATKSSTAAVPQPAAATMTSTMLSQPLEQQLWPSSSFLLPMVQWPHSSNGSAELTRQDHHHTRPSPPQPLLTEASALSLPLAAWIGTMTATGVRSAPGPFVSSMRPPPLALRQGLLRSELPLRQQLPPLPLLHQVEQPQLFSQLLSLSQQLHQPPPPLPAAMQSLHHSLQHLTGRAHRQGLVLPTPIQEDDPLSLALSAATDRQQILTTLQDLRRQHQRELHQLMLLQLLSPLQSPASSLGQQQQHSVSHEHAPISGNGHHYQ